MTYGSSTTVSRCEAGLVAPSRRVARSAASRAAFGRSNSLGRTADAEAEPGLRLVAVVGQRADRRRSSRSRGRCGGCRWWWPPPTRRTHRRSWRRRCGRGGSMRERQPLELLGQLDLAVGGERGERVVPQLLRDHVDAVGLGEAGPLVGRAELDVVAGLGEHLGDCAVVERAGVGEAGATVADDPDADALALRADEVLDLALVDPDVGLAVARRRPRPARRRPAITVGDLRSRRCLRRSTPVGDRGCGRSLMPRCRRWSST